MIERSVPTFFPLTLVRTSGLPLSIWKEMEKSVIALDFFALEKGYKTAVQTAFDKALQEIPTGELRTAIYNARKQFFQRGKLPSPAVWSGWNTSPHTSQLIQACTAWVVYLAKKQAFLLDFDYKLQENYQFLQHMAKDKLLLRGLLFSSHDLLNELPDWSQKKFSDWRAKDQKTALSLFQYLTRMGLKTSPRSHFTTVNVHDWASARQEEEGPGAWFEEKISVTPNVALLPVLYDVLLQEPAFYRGLQIRLNPSIAIGNTKNWLYFDGEQEAFQQMQPNPAVQALLDILLEKGRKSSFVELKRILSERFEVTSEQLETLILQSVSVGLLEWDWPEKGLSGQWCSSLYQFLGYLPTAPMLTEAAYLLQWLRTTARTLPFQSLEDAQQAQRDTLVQVERFLVSNGAELPPIRVEDIFLEDVVRQYPQSLTYDNVKGMVQQLAHLWNRQDEQLQPAFRSRILAFANTLLKSEQVLDFLEFSQQFMSAKWSEDAPQYLPRYTGKIGVMLQVFKENGQYKSVINGMFPGGGKLFARWKSAFSQAQWETLQIWMAEHVVRTAAFPWQGWSNANFQGPISGISVLVPGSRVGDSNTQKELLLADIGVLKKRDGSIHLVEKKNQNPILLLDLGLEAPETRPPVMQILWHLATPYVSADALLPEGVQWVQEDGFRHHARVEYQDLVLARATWDIAPACWHALFPKDKKAPARYVQGAIQLIEMGIPKRFFGRFLQKKREKPQYYDLSCPISLVLLEKNMRTGSGSFRVTEMLPTPAQTPGTHTMEYVLEWEAG